MEGRCQYTVFFSAALNLQNIQITDKKLSPISPSFNPCGPCRLRHAYNVFVDGPLQFQSSQSLRTATSSASLRCSTPCHFNPCGPCGPRPMECISAMPTFLFQSLRSLRTATACGLPRRCSPAYFNPRGPCGPRPASRWMSAASTGNFNPCGPCGPRQPKSVCNWHRLGNVRCAVDGFQSSRSLRTATTKRTTPAQPKKSFQPLRSLRTATEGSAG